MDDLISRSALEEKIRENSMKIRFFDPSVNVILHLIRYAPAVNRWIPCSERLPEEGQNVLVVVEEKQYCDEEADDHTDVVRYVISDTYRENRFAWTYPEEVTHWMPLPEPPETDMIDAQPKVDAVPVKHGKLIEGRYPNDFKCSECGQVFRDDIIWIYDIEDKGHQKFPPEYCPECGVKWSGCEFIDELEQKGGA